MIVETRKTAAGTEYWDNKEKKVLFVPAGMDPYFEVTENPKSMIMGVDLASGPDKTVIDGELVDDEDVMNFSKMTVSQLKKFAAEHNIDIPDDMKKKDDIISFLTEETE
ncbi:hypothetical protein QNH20_16490 [Neobacillus sp. WH10]|uniref:hypothetical protein n=1 Tax=Neobacillus sp. WH10 TaxID=3047873 RepID=UPI0024C17FA9|nr:hypothetical protein [Neobacillus sp. WH10]WHY75717.1 hypothetical protein QNH20_16490 [Neobacillus sp. WH10]